MEKSGTRATISEQAVGTQLSGYLWPNGEFSFGKSKTTRSRVEEGWDVDTPLFPTGAFELESVLDQLNGNYVGYDPVSGVGLVNVPNSHSKTTRAVVELRSVRGSKGLSAYGGKQIRNGCYLIDRSSPNLTVSFGTVTVPNLSTELHRELIREWPSILRIFFQRLNRHLVREGMSGEICYAVEPHPQRSKKEGRMVPHVHMCFQGCKDPYKPKWAISPEQLGRYWKEAIVRRLPESNCYFRKSHWNLQAVNGSVAAYLAKYLAKGREERGDKPGYDNGYGRLSSWFGLIGGLRQRVNQAKRRMNTSDCLAMIDTAKEDKHVGEQFYFYRDIEIEISGVKIWIGGCGKLTPNYSKSWHEYLEASRAIDRVAWEGML